MRILIVEDGRSNKRVLRTCLSVAGHEVAVVRDMTDALAQVLKACPHLVICDLTKPLTCGVALIHEIRLQSQVPIIVLSESNEDASKVAVLDEGADDYLTKPFSVLELMARLRVQQRWRAKARGVGLITVGEFRVDLNLHQAMVRGAKLHLTPQEFALLLFFVRNPSRVLTHEELLRAIWSAPSSNLHKLRTLITQLRRKIELAAALDYKPRYILSERHMGYRLSLQQPEYIWEFQGMRTVPACKQKRPIPAIRPASLAYGPTKAKAPTTHT